MRSQTLKQMGRLSESIALPVLDLTMRPRELKHTRRGAGLAILIGQCQSFGARARDSGRQCDRGGPTRLEPDTLA